jgi:hypothetical protein
MFARCCKDHRVFVVSTGIDPKEVGEMFMTGFTSISEAAAAALSSYARPSVLCIPYAGDCIPVVESAATAAGS